MKDKDKTNERPGPEVTMVSEVAPPNPEVTVDTEVARSAEVTQEEQKMLAVVASEKGLRLRVGPAVSYDILKILPDKTTVDVLAMPSGAEVPGWVPVSADGQVGWVMAQYLSSAE